ncbi:enoyl-CoA hydratase/isomerase family protein [Anaeromyxobacter diazotrophicus]|uniref:Enoyl-CoA hydratase n=1 Tax=Anaeromyxobacter diazotrophicus TaxID=2590199 RepID=A0A7I9VLE4_9BACT|nr:enoyl-CoA hydratase-related protein [Anaeromyxobacter diazotrophicus]GEJ56807.1 enoyl-CoA hydratase [Anaeromyxobacter diazotrophicus]
MSARRLSTEDRGAIRVLTLSNPDKRNALDFASLVELEEACAAAARDGVRCLVFRGAGDKAFCSGFDIAAIPTGPQEGDRPDLAVERAMEAVEAVPCPTIAFLNGGAFGAGAELAATCDLRVARPGVQLGMPPAKLGVVYAPAGLRRFLHLVGPARVRELFFTGRPVEAEEALAMGLIDRLVPGDGAAPAALALAEEIARNAPLAVQGMKRTLRLLEAAAERGFTDAERTEIAELRRRAFESDDVREGRAAFLEKRPPRFGGR